MPSPTTTTSRIADLVGRSTDELECNADLVCVALQVPGFAGDDPEIYEYLHALRLDINVELIGRYMAQGEAVQHA